MAELLEDYGKLSDEELDLKIEDVMKKLDIAYSMGQGPVVDQLVFHLDNLKLELGERLEKQRFGIITDKTPEQYNITDDELKSSEESKDET
ncbi:uncharacterized protein METZ01_LOCUS274885 [marine metagenome]|uniref:Uncharacterized protein n=1 Tax=marine metagenome TaxID=408172 RepID=A0A382KH32_9ZZZZ